MVRLGLGVTRSHIWWRSCICLSIVLGGVHYLTTPSYSHSAKQAKPILINSGWKYRWGDSLINPESIPSSIAKNSSGWQSLVIPSKLEIPPQEDSIWLSIRLPQENWAFPCLYFPLVAHLQQVYLDQELI